MKELKSRWVLGAWMSLLAVGAGCGPAPSEPVPARQARLGRGASALASPNVMGSFDGASASGAFGWAYDPDHPDAPGQGCTSVQSPVKILLHVDKNPHKVFYANTYRGDLPGGTGGMVGCYHGFSSPSLAALSPGTHTVDAYGLDPEAGTWVLLPGSPKTLSIPAGADHVLSSTYGNVTVRLDLYRGGMVDNILINGLPEPVLINDQDGRGLGTSGFNFINNLYRGGARWTPLFNESGNANAVDDATQVYSGDLGNRCGLLQTARGMESTGRPWLWANCTNTVDWQTLDFLSYDSDFRVNEPGGPVLDLHIAHRASWPDVYDGTLKIEQTLYNGTATALAPAAYNDTYLFPISPQLHLNRRMFSTAGQNGGAGYWYYREASGNWMPFTPAKDGGWLARPVPPSNYSADYYAASGHAIAVYSNASRTWGVGVSCPGGQYDSGFYVKDMDAQGIMFIGSRWPLPSTIGAYQSLKKSCYVVFGSESVIRSMIDRYPQQ
ncbi:MAG TPA: hypothetical protein VFZ09_42675 [Archangium sp.]|uniref:hypothetical protein n=1 Tax=Archangium sp. TaxID=1872627 RepID=UPI002E33D16D|nr:hypothetical protein [Archangium sp.]HEX5752986.1 hypothetical protein [Archangium sp.]